MVEANASPAKNRPLSPHLQIYKPMLTMMISIVHRMTGGALFFGTLLFEALGCSCSVIDTPPYGAYVVVSLDGSPHGQNDMFASEAEPEQLALEEAMAGAGIGMPGSIFCPINAG